VVDDLKQAGIPREAEPAKDRAPGRQIREQQPPGNAAAQDVEDRIQDLLGGPTPGSPAGEWLRQKRLNQRHPASVNSASYRKPSRLYSRRVVGVHIAGFQVRLQHPLGFTATLTTQPFSGRALTQIVELIPINRLAIRALRARLKFPSRTRVADIMLLRTVPTFG
jgi:hypothetical protein